MSKTVEAFLEKFDTWRPGLDLLRELMLEAGLDETVKWGMPVYMVDNKNVAGMGAFKSYIGIWFFQGALLKDPKQKLLNAQEGKTKAMRQWRFGSLAEIVANRKTILQYLEEAIENQKAGREIKPVPSAPLVVPAELKQALAADPELKKAFQALSPGKRREYAEHIGEAKRAETRQSRLEKALPLIRSGKGLNEKYTRKE